MFRELPAHRTHIELLDWILKNCPASAQHRHSPRIVSGVRLPVEEQSRRNRVPGSLWITSREPLCQDMFKFPMRADGSGLQRATDVKFSRERSTRHS